MREMTIRKGIIISVICACFLLLEFAVAAIASALVFGMLIGPATVFFFAGLELVIGLTLAAALLAPMCAVADRLCKSRKIGWKLFFSALGVVAAVDIFIGPFVLDLSFETSLGDDYLLGRRFTGTTPCFSPTGDKIVFCSLRDESGHIWIMNGDGSGLTQLTEDSAWDIRPTFSPDGSRIMFLSDRDTKSRYGTLYWMNPDGSDLKAVFEDGREVTEASLSPDGSKILFTRWAGGQSDVHIVNSQGTGLKQMTDDSYRESSLCFSADAERIAFSRSYGGTDATEVVVMDADGGNERLLTLDSHWDKPVCFSPDGMKVLYSKVVADAHTEMWSGNVDGSDTELLSGEASPKFFLPDGSTIIFVSDRAVSGEYELYSMDLDGPDERQLTRLGGCISDPSCSSDGKHILFLFEPKSCPDRGKSDIYVMNADGLDLRKVGRNY